MAIYKVNPLAPQDAVALAPLVNSHEADVLESELKALFKLMYDSYVRPSERTNNTLGTPHLGPFDQVERAVKAEGLALTRRGSEDALRYLFRAWRARNPKRGLHMLRAYLQLLWPNGWDADQMWQDTAVTYPLGLRFASTGSNFLTSRVQVMISSGLVDGSDIQAATPALRSVLPARILLRVTAGTKLAQSVSLSCGVYAGATVQSFEGEFIREPKPLNMANRAYQGAALETFSGSFI